MSTEKSIKWLTASATLVYIAQEVANLNPQDPISRTCIFCGNPIGTDTPLEAHAERKCAWRHAKEFMGEPWSTTITPTKSGT